MTPELPSSLPTQPPNYRWWTWSTIVSGALWIVFSAAPTVLTTAMGVPFALYALIGGWYLRHLSLRQNDLGSARRATWGISLGCVGCAWQVAVWAFLAVVGVGLIATGIGEAFKYLQGTPTP